MSGACQCLCESEAFGLVKSDQNWAAEWVTLRPAGGVKAHCAGVVVKDTKIGVPVPVSLTGEDNSF